jgi:hypothetical protein
VRLAGHREQGDKSVGACTMPKQRSFAFYIGVAILAVQVVMIAVARFHPMRYYCWAPYDSQNEYRITATIDNRELPSEEVERRYRIPAQGINPRTIYEVIDIVSYVERVYHDLDAAEVTVTYRTNGSEEKRWQWPG